MRRRRSDVDLHERYRRRYLGRFLNSSSPAGERMFQEAFFDRLLQERTNDESLLELKLSSFHSNTIDRDSLLNAINNNQNVKTVGIDGYFVEKLSPTDQKLMWEVIGNLPNLEILNLSIFRQHRLSSCALKAVLRRANCLTKLNIHDAVLSPCSSDNSISLEHLSTLTTIAITHVNLSEHHPRDDFHALVAMCVSAPNLQNLLLYMAERPHEGLLSCNTLNLLAQTKLITLQLRQIVYDNNSLSHFLMNHLSNNGTSPLSQTLQELVVHTENHLSHAGCVSIGTMLQHNTTLRRLDLWGSTMDEDGLLYMIDSLRSNRTLKLLFMSHKTDSVVRAQEAFTDMLRNHNFCLQTLTMGGWTGECLETIQFFLTMNSTQIRGLLLDVNATQRDILDALARQVDNLNHVFHLLRSNPSFMS
jgi:hypothetical protein